jgi:hypothetical protein
VREPYRVDPADEITLRKPDRTAAGSKVSRIGDVWAADAD